VTGTYFVRALVVPDESARYGVGPGQLTLAKSGNAALK
jgi:hypothetical protein